MSSNPRPKLKSLNLKRVTPETKFSIDFDWWEKSNLDLKTYLYSRLAIGADVKLESDFDIVDLVDSETGEVRQVEGFQYALQTYFNQLPDDFAKRSSLVDAVFCVLLGNANQPMSAAAIAQRIHRPTNVVMKTLGGAKIYQGIRPLFDDV